MPIAASEWAAGQIEPEAERPAPSPAGGTDSHERVRSFLESNDRLAFSRAEVVRGAAAREDMSGEALAQTLGQLPNQLADLRADFEAGGIEVAALSAVVDDLRDEGVVTCRRIERGDGERAVYYRCVAQ
jgi:hypothetical protein